MLVVVKKPISYLRSNVEKRNDKKKNFQIIGITS